MGQKVNPHGLRVGIVKDWDSKWYDESCYDEEFYYATKGTISRIGVIKNLNFIIKQKERVRAKVQQFIRADMKRFTERLVLPRNKLLT